MTRILACGKIKDSALDDGAQRLETQRFYPQGPERGKDLWEKGHDSPVDQEVSPRLQSGLKEIFGMQQQGAGVGFVFMDQKRNTREKEESSQKLPYT